MKRRGFLQSMAGLGSSLLLPEDFNPTKRVYSFGRKPTAELYGTNGKLLGLCFEEHKQERQNLGRTLVTKIVIPIVGGGVIGNAVITIPKLGECRAAIREFGPVYGRGGETFQLTITRGAS